MHGTQWNFPVFQFNDPITQPILQPYNQFHNRSEANKLWRSQGICNCKSIRNIQCECFGYIKYLNRSAPLFLLSPTFFLLYFHINFIAFAEDTPKIQPDMNVHFNVVSTNILIKWNKILSLNVNDMRHKQTNAKTDSDNDHWNQLGAQFYRYPSLIKCLQNDNVTGKAEWIQ